MNKLMRFLRFLRVTDESDNLSITNILVVAISVKLLLMPVVDATVITGFVLSLLQYAHKRHLMLAEQRKTTDLTTGVIEAAKEEIDKLATTVKEQLDNNKDKIAEHDDLIDKLRTATGFKKIGEV